MIIDSVKNKDFYHFGDAWQKAFAFLDTLPADTPEGKYEIQGEDIFAIVMCYDTCKAESSILESHRKYVDIQTVLEGAERFECANSEQLSINVPYDESKDIQLYELPKEKCTTVDIYPGKFIMLYPQDAHMAALMIEEKSEYIKKVVVKIKAELLLSSSL